MVGVGMAGADGSRGVGCAAEGGVGAGGQCGGAGRRDGVAGRRIDQRGVRGGRAGSRSAPGVPGRSCAR